MIHLDCFAGIGGFSIATDRVWDNVKHVFVEINKWCHDWALKVHWPEAEFHYDIKKFKYTGRVDILTAGVPCQPASIAGKRKGTSDSRWLWPEAIRVLGETKPQWAIFENPVGILSLEGGLVFENLLTQMEGEGYEVQAFIIPACATGAPHRRDRVWIVAYNAKQRGRRLSEPNGRFADVNSNGHDRHTNGSVRHERMFEEMARCEQGSDSTGSNSDVTDTEKAEFEQSGNTRERRAGFTNSSINVTDLRSSRCENGKHGKEPEWNTEERRNGSSVWNEQWYEAATRLCTLSDGLPGGLVRPKGWRTNALRAIGNAVVPDIPEQIMRAIKNTSKELAP